MTDPIQKQLNELTIVVGQMKAGVDDIKRLQGDVVSLLRKHDRTDNRVDQLAAIVEKHEIELLALREERIRAQERSNYRDWWLANWRSLLSLFALLCAIGIALWPSLKVLLR